MVHLASIQVVLKQCTGTVEDKRVVASQKLFTVNYCVAAQVKAA